MVQALHPSIDGSVGTGGVALWENWALSGSLAVSQHAMSSVTSQFSAEALKRCQDDASTMLLDLQLQNHTPTTFPFFANDPIVVFCYSDK
jgi:hypothetical protein